MEKEALIGGQEQSNSDEEGGIILYPNPTKEVLFIELDQGTASMCEEEQIIYVYDHTGKQVDLLKVNSQTTLSYDVSALSDGMYFVSFQCEEAVLATSKFLKN